MLALCLAGFATGGCGPRDADEKLFQAASQNGFVYGYESYLKYHPNGRHATEAREKIAWLRTQRAVVVSEHPAKVSVNTRDHNSYEWEMVFRETGGKIGYTASLRVPRKIRFNVGASGEVTWEGKPRLFVPAGGEMRHHFRIENLSRGENGSAHAYWEIEDQAGNRSDVSETVVLVWDTNVSR